MYRRDDWVEANFPLGPSKRKADLESGWYRGSTPLFLNSQGSPCNVVNLDHFSSIVGLKVVAGDLRKIFSTEIAQNKSQAS